MAIGNHTLGAPIIDPPADLKTIKPDTLIRTCNSKLPSTLSEYPHTPTRVHAVIGRLEGLFTGIEYARPEHSVGETP